MTRQVIITPSPFAMQGLHPELQQWIRAVTLAANGGREGEDAITSNGEATAGIQKGTIPLEAVTLRDSGDLGAQIEALGINVNTALTQASSAAAAGGGAASLAIVASRTGVSGSGGFGEDVVTGNITFTASGGVAPYSIAVTRESGATIPATNASGTGGSLTTTHQKTMGGQSESAAYRATVTDDDGTAVSTTYAVTLINNDQFNSSTTTLDP